MDEAVKKLKERVIGKGAALRTNEVKLLYVKDTALVAVSQEYITDL